MTKWTKAAVTLVFVTMAALTLASGVRVVASGGVPFPGAQNLGWFGIGGDAIGIVRPGSMHWLLATAGGCPTGFAPLQNSDGTPMCSAQFGIPNLDSILAGFRVEGQTVTAVARLPESRLYFQPATGTCPNGSKPAGRLASGAAYCFKSIVARPGMWPLVFNLYNYNSEIAAWDPSTLTFTFPLIANSCPAGMSSSSGRCSLVWGNNRIIPRLTDYDGDGLSDIGFYDPQAGSHFFIPSGRVCPAGTVRNGTVGTVNRANSCRLVGTAGQVAVVPADLDGDGVADALNYDVVSGTFSLIPSSRVCPFTFTISGRDALGRATCTAHVGVGGSDSAIESGDFDNDGRSEPVVINETTYVWRILPSSGVCPVTTTTGVDLGNMVCTKQFGLPPDRAIH